MKFSNWTAVSIATIVAATACSKGDSSPDTAAADSTQQSEQLDTAARNAAVAAQPGTGNSAPVTVEDIDKWQRGMAAELEAVKDAGVRLKSAKTAQDSLDAMMRANDMSTLEAGARASGSRCSPRSRCARRSRSSAGRSPCRSTCGRFARRQ